MARKLVTALLMLGLSQSTMAIEKPHYEVLMTSDDFEVRRYAEYIVAEVEVDGEMRESGDSAFRVLAGYIFGNNVAREKMRMTAPVEATEAGRSERMKMTAPVEARPGDDGTTTYAFVMERKYTLETLPKPVDPRIRIAVRPARTMAVRRYSGTWSEDRYAEHLEALLAALARDDINAVGLPVWARYNSPMTPWFMRRNEVMIEVDWPSAANPGGAPTD